MRIRIALTLGALVLAGGALTGGIALADQAPAAPTQTTVRPTDPPTVVPAPATSRTRPQVPTNVPVPRETQKPRTGQAPRVPRAVPAGPTGDLNLPAVWETR
ncbi:hypothetical protein [Amycolatopsis sp. NPDC021455]|uniref:hypothetical protein n=1 Tax=Amycolatopsis sp. NPDC021455 TaxID=3154901 RepID=UPI0033CD5BDA